MKTRFRLIRRNERLHRFYCLDTVTGNRISLQTQDEDVAQSYGCRGRIFAWLSVLIHDRSSVFTEQFRETLRSAGVESLKLPARSPRSDLFVASRNRVWTT